MFVVVVFVVVVFFCFFLPKAVFLCLFGGVYWRVVCLFIEVFVCLLGVVDVFVGRVLSFIFIFFIFVFPFLKGEPVPSTIVVPVCVDVLPYGQFISDTKAPGWGIVKPLASCSTDAMLMFCAMAHPEFHPQSALLYQQQRAPCREVCQRVFLECDILFQALDRNVPGICEGLGTDHTEVEHFCAQY